MPMPSEEIQIYVSHRIDLQSALVPNSLYRPMRCGAVFDRNTQSEIPGDDTGDNISEKRMWFCEFTVQYWAWKNADADYYGLCHYRRFLSFAGREDRADDHGLVPWPELTLASMQRFGLLDEDKMRKIIRQYDMIVPRPAPVEKMPLPHGKANTVRKMWEAHDGIFFHKQILERMFQLIDELAPEYAESARRYFAGGIHRGYNCYIMRKPLFDRLCRLQFPILEALEREDYGKGKFPRSPAYVGEMLFGIFCWHVMHEEGVKSLELPLVWFAETEPTDRRIVHIRRYALFWIDRSIRRVVAPIFPLGSWRRELGKQLYRKWTGRSK